MAEPHNAVKVSAACPSSLGLFPHAALTGAQTPDTAFRALFPKITRKDGHLYEPVVRYVIRSHVNPHTGVGLGEKAE